MFYFHSLDGSTVGTRKRLCVFGQRTRTLCIRRTLCRHVTIGTPMVIFCCLTVCWLFLTNGTLYQSPKTLKTIGVGYKSSQVYRDCTNSVPTVYQSSKTVKVCRIHMSTPTVQQYQQCCRLANGNKTCRYLLLFKNIKVARGSQGFVRQSSRNVALRVEQPSVLNKFFFRITIFCRVREWEQKVCGRGLKICKISSLFGPPCSLRRTRKKSN